MPDMSGFEVCHALKSRDAAKDLRVLMMSAPGKPQEIAHAAEAGANGSFSKPIDESALPEKSRAMLDDIEST